MHYRRLYLDTSIIRHLERADKPAEQADCRKLIELIKNNKFDTYVSYATGREIQACEEPLHTILFDHLNSLPCTRVAETDAAVYLADRLIEAGVFGRRMNACQHISIAVAAHCDIIASLDFESMVNPRVAKGVRNVCFQEGFIIPDIYSPRSLIAMGTGEKTMLEILRPIMEQILAEGM